MDQVFTLQEAAEYLKLSTATVTKEIRQGRLHAIKAGRSWRITQQALAQYLNSPEFGPKYPERAIAKEVEAGNIFNKNPRTDHDPYPPVPISTERPSLTDLARQIMETAPRVPKMTSSSFPWERWYGSDFVSVVAVWHQWNSEHAARGQPEIDLEDFKTILATAHSKDFLRLYSLPLAPRDNTPELLESEIRTKEGKVHFIRALAK